MRLLHRPGFAGPANLVMALALVVVSLPLSLVAPPSVSADTWVVTSLADDGGEDTLRYAIENADPYDTIRFGDGLNGVIVLDEGKGPLEIDRPLEIEGPGAGVLAVDGNNLIRVFVIETDFFGIEPSSAEDITALAPAQGESSDVIIRDLTIQNGFADSEDGTYNIRPGGNILIVDASVSLIDCVVQDGEAEIGGGIGVVAAYLEMVRCTIRGNVAADNSEEVFAGAGGGLQAFLAYVEASECTFTGNVAADDGERPGGGGAIVLALAFCGLDNCAISGNTAGLDGLGGFGGGILALLNIALVMDECTVSENTAIAGDTEISATGGGGVAVLASMVTAFRDCLIAQNAVTGDGEFGIGGGLAFASAYVGAVPEYIETTAQPGCFGMIPPIMVNCTVSGNYVEASDIGFGGGIYTYGVPPALNFCTVTDNTADVAGGICAINAYVDETEPSQEEESVVTLKNTIVADNNSNLEIDDILALVDSHGGNLIGSAFEWEYVDAPPEDCDDIVGVDPGLLPLANNGGPTLTHALKDTSPALDGTCDCTVTETFALSPEPEVPPYDPGCWGEVLERDQRGEPRPIDGDADGETACDIGAFEAQPDIILDGGSGDRVAARDTSSGDCSTVYVTIKNDGHAPLLIESVALEGPGAEDYSLLRDPAGTVIGAGDSMRLALNFCPSSSGPKRVTVKVYSSDPDEPVAEVDVVGQAGSGKEEVAPAQTSTSYLNIDPMQVVPGQQVMVTANVCNNGGERGSHTASLAVNGTAEQSQSVTVSPDACKQVVFVVTRAVPGTYDVSIDGMQGQFTVLSPRIVQSSVPSQQGVGIGTAGIIAIVVVLVVLILAIVLIFRQT